MRMSDTSMERQSHLQPQNCNTGIAEETYLRWSCQQQASDGRPSQSRRRSGRVPPISAATARSTPLRDRSVAEIPFANLETKRDAPRGEKEHETEAKRREIEDGERHGCSPPATGSRAVTEASPSSLSTPRIRGSRAEYTGRAAPPATRRTFDPRGSASPTSGPFHHFLRQWPYMGPPSQSHGRAERTAREAVFYGEKCRPFPRRSVAGSSQLCRCSWTPRSFSQRKLDSGRPVG